MAHKGGVIAHRNAVRRSGSGARVIRRVILFDCVEGELCAYADVLRDLGYIVDEASDWSQAATLLGFRPHAVLVDLDANRPLGTGDVLRRTLAFPFEGFPPIVGIGGKDPPAEIGLAAWVRKPVDIDVLLAAVDRVVEMEQTRRANRSASMTAQ